MVSERLTEMALGAGAALPQFVEAVIPHLRPVEDPFNTVLAFETVKDEVLTQYPASVLALTYALLGDRAAAWPYDAKALVERLASQPTLARDPRLAELRRRAAAG